MLISRTVFPGADQVGARRSVGWPAVAHWMGCVHTLIELVACVVQWDIRNAHQTFFTNGGPLCKPSRRTGRFFSFGRCTAVLAVYNAFWGSAKSGVQQRKYKYHFTHMHGNRLLFSFSSSFLLNRIIIIVCMHGTKLLGPRAIQTRTLSKINTIAVATMLSMLPIRTFKRCEFAQVWLFVAQVFLVLEKLLHLPKQTS